MLKKLSVRNFAIIEDIEMNFYDGLTVLTGETGAGKSLIIDSIHLLIGERASIEMIRNGEEKATIVGVFSYKNKRLEALLNTLEIPSNGEEIVVSRIISPTKSVIKINDKVVSLNELKSVSRYLADIHQQFDMVKLLNKENYLDIVDSNRIDLIDDYKNSYQESLKELKEKYSDFLALEKRIQEIKERRDIYEYELKELEAFNLTIGEEEELNNKVEFLKNYDKIYSLLEESKEISDKDSLSDLYQIKNNIEKLSSYQNDYSEMNEKLNDLYYELEAIYEELGKRFRRLDYDPSSLDELETRRNEINLLKKKYKKDIPELIEYQNELKKILQSDEDLDISLNKEKEELKSIYDQTYQKAIDLSKIRKEIAKDIEKELMNNLKDLSLSSRFEISFTTSNNLDLDMSIFKDDGVDEIDFLIETNVGEGLKPLAKIVSGGEMSRIMLAFKALFIKSQKISTVIFDEVDTGISGEIARKVANKIKEISLSTQVISITHLPQVASLSNHHIKISKSISGGRTHTTIKELNLEEKIYEIANLISDGKVTQKQLEYAKEMVLDK